MSRYRTVVDPAVANSSQVLAAEMVGRDKDVLDVGCAAGDLARALSAQGCRVTGVELDEDAASLAEPFLQRLVVGDVAQLDLVGEFGAGAFDSVVFGDVLEHLDDPAHVLQASLDLLRPDGEVVISVPNVAHGALRLALLTGRWRYTDTGLLDRTHLRFYTRESLLQMVAAQGLEVLEFRATVMDALESEVELDDSIPESLVNWVRNQPDAAVYQFVVRARKGDPGATVPDLVPAVEPTPTPTPRAHDAMSWTLERDVLLAEVRELRHTVMTLRDQMIGFAAEAGTAAAKAHRAEVKLLEAEDTLDQLRDSRSYRLGNMVMRPAARVLRRAEPS